MQVPDLTDGRSMIQRMHDGDLYLASDPAIAQAGAMAMEFTATYNATRPTEDDVRRRLLEQHLGSVGEDVELRVPLQVDYGTQLHVGARTFANFGLIALDVVEIRIGEDVKIGPNVQLLTPTHPLDPELRRAKWEAAEAITIGDNVWLGGGVIVCPGVAIGRDTVVGAGSVVTRDLPAGVVAVGSPARVVKQIA